MSTDLGQAFPNTWDGKPARLSPEDYLLWQRWFPIVRESVSVMYFDVGLGDGEPAPPEAPPQYARMWKRNTQKRADAFLVTNEALWIVELRFAANSNAIGRLLQYGKLYEQDPRLGRKYRLVLVSNTLDEAVALTVQSLPISYYIV